MQEFILAGLFGAILIGLCCLSIYEFLRFMWNLLPNVNWPPHLRVLALVGMIFIAHIINIWLFGGVYYLMNMWHIGALTGEAINKGTYVLDIYGCLYYSAVIYSTLGLGDITPQGPMRMITGVEALTGFILIGWTVSFTYLAMQKFWELPHSKQRIPKDT